MIASRKHGFIFLKTRKTAGTSIELALGPHCGPDDALSPISAQHDLTRFAESGVFARNFATAEIQRRYMKALRKGNPKLLKAVLRDPTTIEQRMSAHATPARVKLKLRDLWDRAFRFTVERHPYEKVVSLAAMRAASIRNIVYGDPRYIGHPWYFENGRLIVDRVILYDRLASDFGEVLARIGLPHIELPHARKTERDRSPAREQLSAMQRAYVYEQCAPEFELFGWER